MNVQKIISNLINLDQFAPHYPHRLYKNCQYTDGVREKLIEEGASWVVERIFALQLDQKALKNTKTQLWSLSIFPDRSVLLVCTDKKGIVIHFEHRDPVKYPKENIALVFSDGVLKLKN